MAFVRRTPIIGENVTTVGTQLIETGAVLRAERLTRTGRRQASVDERRKQRISGRKGVGLREKVLLGGTGLRRRRTTTTHRMVPVEQALFTDMLRIRGRQTSKSIEQPGEKRSEGRRSTWRGFLRWSLFASDPSSSERRSHRLDTSPASSANNASERSSTSDDGKTTDPSTFDRSSVCSNESSARRDTRKRRRRRTRACLFISQEK